MGINRSDIDPGGGKSGIAGEPCALCAEFELMADHDDQRLLTLDEVIFGSTPCTICGQCGHGKGMCTVVTNE
jgi:hypothetical protein